jgi:hypothetical protein
MAMNQDSRQHAKERRCCETSHRDKEAAVRNGLVLGLLFAFCASATLAGNEVPKAQGPGGKAKPVLHEAKQKELDAKGITSWRPGKMRRQGKPAFSKLKKSMHKRVPGAQKRGDIADTGTLQYDNGTLTALPTVFGQNYGNDFHRYQGGPPGFQTITLNNVQFYFMEDSVTDTGLFLQPSDPGTVAGQLNARASVNVTGLLNSGASFSNPQLNVVNQTALGTTGVFNSTLFMAAWCLNSATVFPVTNEVIGLGTNQHAGAFHGFTVASGTGPLTYTPGSFQAMLRVNITSPQTVPVELMAIEADE